MALVAGQGQRVAGVGAAEDLGAVPAGHDRPAAAGSGSLDEVVVEPAGRGQAGLAAGLTRDLRPFPAAGAVLVPFGRGGGRVSHTVRDDHAVDGAGRLGGYLLLPHVPGDGVWLAGQRVAVAAAALPGHRENLARGQVAGGVVLPGFERVADLRQGAGHPAVGQHLHNAAVPGDDVQAGVVSRCPARSCR
jgi:hypothetical protein